MNITDKLYTEWAWRTESGVPDINNPKDKAILDRLLSELTENKTNSKQDIIDYIKSTDLDQEQIDKLYNRVRNFTNYRAIRSTVSDKNFHSKIQKQYSLEIQGLLEDLPDEDNKKLVEYLQNESQQIDFPTQNHNGNLFTTIKKTGLPNNVVTALARHTAQDEGKKGVGMGEIALAFLFKNIDSAGKGDLALNGKEFEIKGAGARLGSTKESSGILDLLIPLGFEEYYTAANRRGSLSLALVNFLKDNKDKEKEVKDIVRQALLKVHNSESVNTFFTSIDFSSFDSIKTHLQLMHFHSYALKEKFEYFLAHDFGAGGTDVGNYIFVGGNATAMAKALKPFIESGKVNFETPRANLLGPRISVKEGLFEDEE